MTAGKQARTCPTPSSTNTARSTIATCKVSFARANFTASAIPPLVWLTAPSFSSVSTAFSRGPRTRRACGEAFRVV
eukprot:3980644-Pyramimonas_sp.AAC.1